MDKYRESISEVLRLVSAELAVKLGTLPPVKSQGRDSSWHEIQRLKTLRDNLTATLEEAS